jgi:hypothetical protein
VKARRRWTRLTRSLTVGVLLAAVPATTAAAEPVRTAKTTKYTRASYLQHALGLPTSNTNPAIESVTYDRFQHLLRQQGVYAILIGDPATDATFAARARDVEDVAKQAGIPKVYWFNPNLSGSAKIGAQTVPALDIRDPQSISWLPGTTQGNTSRNRYRDTWLNLIGQSLGNGVSTVRNNPNTQGQTVTITLNAAVVNDAKDPVYPYTDLNEPPADHLDSYFFVYDTNNTFEGQPDKIVSSVNLTEQADSASTKANVSAAINEAGASHFESVSQFEWWKEEANQRAKAAAAGPHQGSEVPIVTDADNNPAKGGWRVVQVTYPEIVHVFKTVSDDEAVILFGGTWCPNTRAVIKFINSYAQEHDVTVYNFDTVLDGGIIAGNPTGGSNPLQTRNPHGNGVYPSFLYGQLVSHYLSNFKTEYTPQQSNRITYYLNGDTASDEQSVARLQVPYLFGYKGDGKDNGYPGVTRQWIIDLGDGTYKEYMSQWYFTNPLPNQINLSPTQLPPNAPVWTTINQRLAGLKWDTDPLDVYFDTSDVSDAAQFLVEGDKANVTINGDNVTVTYNANGSVDISPSALAAALAALGAGAPADLPAARTAYRTAATADEDPELIANLRTVVGAWGVAETRKNTVNTRFGGATTPGSVIGGLAAVHALEVFFAGLPRVVTPQPPAPPQQGGGSPVITPVPTAQPTPTPTPKTKAKVRKLAGKVAKKPTRSKKGTYRVTITTPKGSPKATGKITITLKKGKVKKTVRATLKKGAVTLKLPKLARGTWKVSISWAGDANYRSAKATGASIKVK